MSLKHSGDMSPDMNKAKVLECSRLDMIWLCCKMIVPQTHFRIALCNVNLPCHNRKESHKPTPTA